MKNLFSRIIRPVAAAIVAMAFLPAAANPGSAVHSAQTGPYEDVIVQISAALDSYPLVGIGEDHGQREVGDFYMALLRDPRVMCKLDDIAVEFGNAALQSIADRYVAGEAVSDTEKKSIWRDTGQWMVWDSPIYEEFFDAVRAANVAGLCPRPVRVLLADPPIDWSRVHNAAGYMPYRIRDRFFAETVEREVLAKGRRALLIVGYSHLWKALPEGNAEDLKMGQLIESRHPGALASLMLIDADIASGLGLPPAPSLVQVRGSPYEGRAFIDFLTPGMSIDMMVDGQKVEKPLSEVVWPPVERLVEGLLHLGPAVEAESDPAIYREPAYQAELRRRAVILQEVHGIDFNAILDNHIGQ